MQWVTLQPTPAPLQDGGFAFVDLLEDNLDAVEAQGGGVVLVGVLSNPRDAAHTERFDSIALGLGHRFFRKPGHELTNAAAYAKRRQRTWRVVARALPELPPPHPFGPRTWEWTVVRRQPPSAPRRPHPPPTVAGPSRCGSSGAAWSAGRWCSSTSPCSRARRWRSWRTLPWHWSASWQTRIPTSCPCRCTRTWCVGAGVGAAPEDGVTPLAAQGLAYANLVRSPDRKAMAPALVLSLPRNLSDIPYLPRHAMVPERLAAVHEDPARCGAACLRLRISAG